MRRAVLFGSIIAAIAITSGVVFSCSDIRHTLVPVFSPEYEPAEKAAANQLHPDFDGNDASRARIDVALTLIETGFIQTTDLQFVPNDPSLLIVLEKAGIAKWFDLETKKSGVLFQIAVLDVSEQGLLGLAFHPKFLENGRMYFNYTPTSNNKEVTRVAEWTVPPGSDLRTVKPVEKRTIIEIVQPYQNHNAGQLAFGPDGYLYFGLGDGGWADDPHNHGQDLATALGSMFRIDVDKAEGSKQYAVPADNPFIGREGILPETWAYGLRNPWRYSFAPDGRLVVADVGQDLFEEIDLVDKGANLGWKIREARHCFDPKEGCKTEGLVDPIFEYGREDGGSVTGGFVALADSVPAIKGKYVFGDFLSGRLWALDLPEKAGADAKVYALGRWPILPSTFGRDAEGRLYVADYPSMNIYRIDAK